MTVDADWLRAHIRDIPDFPKPGVVFRDITPLLGDPNAFAFAIDNLAAPFSGAGVTKVLGIEARGFVVAAPLARRFNAGFVPVRKPGKLPGEVEVEPYALEYGSEVLEIHKDAIHPGELVVICDDVLATGGTAAAALRLVQRLGGKVIGLSFLIELAALGGRAKVPGIEIHSLVTYD
jgi:adenine phosphoribosyltransferase